MALGKLPEADGDEGGGGIFADINITPLTDIFLVLLIIFMVTSTVRMQEMETATRLGLKVNLPKGATKEIDPAAKSLVVSVMKGGQVLVQNQPVKNADLEQLFRTTAARAPETQIIIEADEGVRHGEVVGIMGLAKTAGLSRLAIATRGGK